MSELLAVDIVLLPPIGAMKQIIGLSDELPDAPTRLNTNDCLPHVSLAMGVLSSDKLSLAKQALEKLADNQKPLRLTAQQPRQYITPDHKNFSDLTVEPTDKLVQLYIEIAEAFKSLLTHNDVRTDMFVSPPQVAETSTFWVKHYYDKLGAENFRPHITLGEGDSKDLRSPIEFVASRLALCHLGTHCTCRKILAEASLRS